MLRNVYSVSERSCLHLDLARTRRRPQPLRASLRTLESDPERGEDSDLCDEHDRGAQRREPGERRRGEDVA